MGVVAEVWKRTVPAQVRGRFGRLQQDFVELRERGYWPEKVVRVVDVGYGSGAGAVALKDIYDLAEVVGVDNASSQQHETRYRRRNLPRWADFGECLEDVRVAAGGLGQFGLVVAMDLPFSEVRPTWREACVNAAGMAQVLAGLAGPEGKVAVGYNSFEARKALGRLQQNVKLGEVFAEICEVEVAGGDRWLVMAGVRAEGLAMAPGRLLTELGEREKSPYASFTSRF